jgi:hypothetical protein
MPGPLVSARRVASTPPPESLAADRAPAFAICREILEAPRKNSQSTCSTKASGCLFAPDAPKGEEYFSEVVAFFDRYLEK